MVVDHSVLTGCVVGLYFLFIFFWGVNSLGRPRLEAKRYNPPSEQ